MFAVFSHYHCQSWREGLGSVGEVHMHVGGSIALGISQSFVGSDKTHSKVPQMGADFFALM